MGISCVNVVSLLLVYVMQIKYLVVECGVNCELEVLLLEKEIVWCFEVGIGFILFEFVMLMVYVKLGFKEEVLVIELLDQDVFVFRLFCYFLMVLCEWFILEICFYQLCCEIVIIMLINDLVDIVGIIYVFWIVEDVGVMLIDVVCIYVVIDVIFGVGYIWCWICVVNLLIVLLDRLMLDICWLIDCVGCWLFNYCLQFLVVGVEIN